MGAKMTKVGKMPMPKFGKKMPMPMPASAPPSVPPVKMAGKVKAKK